MADGSKERAFIPLGIAVLTVSDTRSLAEDRSGQTLADRIMEAGHSLAARDIVRDDVEAIRGAVRAWCADPQVDVVITTGGTGFTGRDVTPEALEPLFDKKMDGFSTIFHRISYDKIGTSTIQSRATGGVIGTTFVFVLPGSPGACRDAWDAILAQQLDYRHRPCNFVEIMPRLDEHLRRGARGKTRSGRQPVRLVSLCDRHPGRRRRPGIHCSLRLHAENTRIRGKIGSAFLSAANRSRVAFGARDDVGGFERRLPRDLTKEIHPLRILRLDQFELPLPAPSLDALLVGDGILDVVVEAVPDQPLHVISLREPRDIALPVLLDPAVQVRGHPGVERAVLSRGHDVDVPWHGKNKTHFCTVGDGPTSAPSSKPSGYPSFWPSSGLAPMRPSSRAPEATRDPFFSQVTRRKHPA
jgi:molybdenum cofactor biosynthesis protein B